ncbi:FMN-binding protein [Ectothiorhodospira mobilis]|uniref:FMN-binding protein n=1 Tax=Ectothiorhodospira mobilis TaxID=195064 RepID=UPI001906BEA5|nr:FMN-binding protein [Ectothiorhodospira mobilis]MBK1692256.1 FMN-binding protein [Ectothiorhodospira mobilis]
MSRAASLQQQPKPTSGFRLVATLGLIALFSGLLVVSVYEYTRPFIAQNQQRALEAAVLEVIPGAETRRSFVLTDTGLFPRDEAPAAGRAIYAAYDADGSLAGVALEASGRGYADVIRILYGYDPDCACIVGMTVLESRETPGLGDKIETEPHFLESLQGLEARLNAEGTGLAHRIRTVDQGEADDPWEIDGITGATISSEAIGDMIHASADAVLPRLAAHWDTLRRAAPRPDQP